jgi:predicted dehydrogenase
MQLSAQTGITVGILGTGRMARLHAIALKHLREEGGITVNGETWPVDIALYGRDPVKVAALAQEIGIRRTSTDLNAFIDDPDIHVIDNCLINSLHYEPLLRAVRNGKHAFTDKPLTIHLHEAEHLLEEARKAGVHHGIIQNMRFAAGPARAREILQSGELGQVFHVRLVFGYFVPQRVTNRPAWFYQKEAAGGGIVHDMMAHFFDLLRYMIGPIQSIYCATEIFFPEREDAEGHRFKVEVEDSAAVILRFTNGALGDIFASWVRHKHEEIPFIEIDCEKGGLLCTFTKLHVQRVEEDGLFRYDPTQVQEGYGEGWTPIELAYRDPIYVQLKEFLTGIATGKPVRPDWEDAVINQRLIEAAYESAEKGCRVVVG